MSDMTRYRTSMSPDGADMILCEFMDVRNERDKARAERDALAASREWRVIDAWRILRGEDDQPTERTE